MNAFLAIVIVSEFVFVQPQSAVPGPDRESVVAALRHHEGLVKTLQADYEYSLLETPAEQAAIIKQQLGKAADDSIRTAEDAMRQSGSARLWRHGPKQRDEFFPLGPAHLPDLKRAFNGQVLRVVNYAGPNGRPVAVIASGKTGDWYSMPRQDPMAFMYLFYEQSFSDVIASASMFSSAVVTRGKDRLFRVLVHCPPPSQFALEFIFDQRFLQKERAVMICRDRQRQILLPNHKLVFSGYHSFDTPSGEKIWFPEEVAYTGYSMEASAADGTPLEIVWKAYRFKKVQFNIEMADSLFDLEIPENAQINDRLTGVGWIPDDSSFIGALFPPESRARRIWLVAILTCAVLLITVAFFYKRWRKQRTVGAD
jgi:hypothetical protein